MSFSYNGSPTLRNVSLSIPKGKTVAIVGATGSGKSTLVQLIPRLYNAPPNSLFIDGVPIERIPLASLRSAIGFIPQDTFLFGETIRENIAFGVESATDAEIQANRGFFKRKMDATRERNSVVKAIKHGPFDFILLDARSRDAFKFGHITGAWSR